MLSYETIEPRTLDLLKVLMQEPAFADMRLVGGTALALQYGHRQSIDLDFLEISDANRKKRKKYYPNMEKLRCLRKLSAYVFIQ